MMFKITMSILTLSCYSFMLPQLSNATTVNIASYSSTGNPNIQYIYNPKEQLQSVTDIYDNITSYEYNNGLLATVFYQAHNSSTPLKLAQYNYDAFNRIASIDYYNSNAQEYRYKMYSYQDDQTGQLQSLEEYTGSEQGAHKLQSKVSYIYDVDKNIKTQTISDNITNTDVSDTYKYNVINQLIEDVQQATGQALKTTTYTYDADGNIYTRSIKDSSGTSTNTYISDALDQLTTVNQVDINGNQQTYKFQYDANGNLFHDEKGDILTYNSFDQLIGFTTPTDQETSYLYYPSGLLSYIGKRNITNAPAINIYYDDSNNPQTISEYYQANNSNPTHAISYIYGGNERLLRQVDTSADLQSYIKNAKGDVLKVVGNTKDSQAIDYQYTAYGKPVKQPKTEDQAVSNPFMYNGERYDSNTGLEYLRARFYSPELMRFINQDSTDILNRFAYGNGNPITNIDPSGHSAWDFIGLGLGITTAILTTFTPEGMVRDAFMFTGDASASFTSAFGDFKNKKYFAGAGDLLIGFSGMAGTYSAQPEMFASGRAAKAAKQDLSALELEERPGFQLPQDLGTARKANRINYTSQIAKKDKYVTISSTASNALAGSGAGLKGYQDRNGNSFDGGDFARYVGLGLVSGIAGGYVYGKMSSGIDANTPILKGMALGAKRTFTNGFIGSMGDMANNLISSAEDNNWSQFKSGGYWMDKGMNWGVGAALGAFSGFSQINLARNTGAKSWLSLRYAYLNLKSPIFGKLLAGHISDYGNFTI